MPVTRVTTTAIRKYTDKRLESGRANATINRELAALKRMLSLAKQGGRIATVPHIPMLKEAPPREGFLEYGDFLRVLEHLPAWAKPICEFAYRTGWRQGEILGLAWDRVNLDQKTIRLRVPGRQRMRVPGTTPCPRGPCPYFEPSFKTVSWR